jgi:hypothetical protein
MYALNSSPGMAKKKKKKKKKKKERKRGTKIKDPVLINKSQACDIKL